MDELSQAIIKVRHKIIPQLDSAKVFTQDQQHVQLYNLLNIFDHPDEDTEEQVKYIYDFFQNNGGNPKDQIVATFTKLGSARVGETDAGRIYRYCRLQAKANNDLARYENTRRSIDALSNR